MLVYILCLILLGIPALVMEFSIGRAAQTSPALHVSETGKTRAEMGNFRLDVLYRKSFPDGILYRGLRMDHLLFL